MNPLPTGHDRPMHMSTTLPLYRRLATHYRGAIEAGSLRPGERMPSLRNLMRLEPAIADRVTVRHFGGGHMFYAWEASRRAFTAAISEFVAGAMTG